VFRGNNANAIGKFILAMLVFPFLALIYIVIVAVKGLAVFAFISVFVFMILSWFSFGRTILFYIAAMLLFRGLKAYYEEHYPLRRVRQGRR